jgi:hypothetical protein
MDIGWIGTFFGLMSFGLLSLGIIKKEQIIFSLSIVCSSSCFFISSYFLHNYQGMASNVFYFLSSVLAVCGIFINIQHITERMLYVSSILIFIIASFFYLYTHTHGWFFQSIGWVPVLAAPMTFFLITQRKIDEMKYFLLNLMINIVFFTHLIYIGNYPIAVTQLVAAAFAIYGCIRIIRINKKLVANNII